METLRVILFADIAGSTGLYEQSGDTVAMAAVVACVDALREATLAQQGRVVKTIGDTVNLAARTPSPGGRRASASSSRSSRSTRPCR